MMSVDSVRRWMPSGERFGLKEGFSRPAVPSAQKRASHFWAERTEIPNTSHLWRVVKPRSMHLQVGARDGVGLKEMPDPQLVSMPSDLFRHGTDDDEVFGGHGESIRRGAGSGMARSCSCAYRTFGCIRLLVVSSPGGCPVAQLQIGIERMATGDGVRSNRNSHMRRIAG
jgi:hypothetical protein